MRKSLLYRLFGIGRLPDAHRARIEAEGVVLIDEGVRATTTYRNFRAPHRRSNWRREWHAASIALTGRRLAAFRHTAPIIDVPLADERFKKLRFSVEEENTLVVAFDAAVFHDDWSGELEYRFRTALAGDFLERLRAAAE